MTPEDFIKEVKSEARRPLYVISGGERSAVSRCLKAAEEAVEASFRDFNHQIINLEAGQARRLVGEASTRPFFVPPRVVATKNPPFGGDDWNHLSDYLDSPNDETTLLIVLDKVDGRLNFFKKVKSAGAMVDCDPPKGVALRKWLVEEFRTRGVTLADGPADLLIERAGTDASVLAGEAEKLSLFLGEGGVVSAALVKEMVSLAMEAKDFALVEALGRQDASGAQATLMEHLTTEPPLQVLPRIVSFFRVMLRVKTRQSSTGLTRLPKDEAGRLGLHPFVLEKNQPQAARWLWQSLAEALSLLEDAHRDLVTSAAPPQMIMENLSLRLSTMLKAAGR
jgi:DNA polymerase-3 subunit delta